MNNKLIRVLAAGALVAALLSSAVYAAPSSKELKEKQSEKQGQLDSLTEKKESVDSEITSYIEQIAEVKKSQKKVESQLRAAEAQVDEQYADMKDRIRFMYEDGGVSLLNILFESKDMGDFVNKAYYISTISDYDRQMLVKLKKASLKVEEKKEELKAKRDRLEELQEERLKEQEALAERIEQAEKELAAAREAYEKAAAAEKAEARRKLREARERARAAEQETTPPGGGSSGPAPAPAPGSQGNSGKSSNWNGQKLSPSAGTIMGPSGKETYYNLDMSGIVRIMRSMGNKDKYWVRSDGVKMLGDYVMVAANLSLRPRGSHIRTSLGMGIVCDTGGFAASNATQLDIATNW